MKIVYNVLCCCSFSYTYYIILLIYLQKLVRKTTIFPENKLICTRAKLSTSVFSHALASSENIPNILLLNFSSIKTYTIKFKRKWFIIIIIILSVYISLYIYRSFAWIAGIEKKKNILHLHTRNYSLKIRISFSRLWTVNRYRVIYFVSFQYFNIKSVCICTCCVSWFHIVWDFIIYRSFIIRFSNKKKNRLFLVSFIFISFCWFSREKWEKCEYK